MHETHLFKNIFRYFENEEKKSSKKIKKVYISLSEFSSFKKGHFLQHYKESIIGTKWQDLDLELNNVPYGPELEITKIDFE
ncbi:MAG: hypothetical protein AB1472_02095 [Candidatus Omnitrophota bacterium]